MRVFKKKSILDSAKLDAELIRCQSMVSDPLTTSGIIPDELRKALLSTFRDALKSGREQLHQYHIQGASGQFIVQGHAHLMDLVLHRIFSLVQKGEIPKKSDQTYPETSCATKGGVFSIGEKFKNKVQTYTKSGSENFCLIATGGYGRGELAPFSDIDLLFLLPENASPELSQRVERSLYCLWDLGLDLGHAVRTVPECVQLARQNIEIRTSMLESRFLGGDQALFNQYRTTLFAKVFEKGPESFLRAKLLEQTKRHERFGNSLFYLEPNVKENPGGLRDLQTFAWISKYRYQVERVRDLVTEKLITEEEYNTFTRSRSFLRKVRNALHYRAGRREDRLTFQYQVDIAKEFSYTDRRGMRGVEQFMRRYYQVVRQVGNLSWIFLRKYQEEHRKISWWNKRKLEPGFDLYGDKVVVSNPDLFRQDPTCLMRLFEVAQRHLKAIHPDTLRLVNRDLCLINWAYRKNLEVAKLFLKMLDGDRAVAWVLRRMNTSGMLGRYLPEFGRVIGQTQHDMFHVYTVDEHTLLAVEALRHISSGRFKEELPISTALMNGLKNPVILYLAVLFHDIAKGRGGDHSLKGAVVSRKICMRLGLSEPETGMVSWLVGRHLIFSRTAFRRDIHDPETVMDFARQIGNQKRLDLLLLLTVADIRAVGPGVWNLWKATLLRRLYRLTLEVLNKGAFGPEEIAVQAKTQKETVIRLLGEKADPQKVRTHLDRFYPEYFMHYEVETVAMHCLALAERKGELLTILFCPTPATDTTEVLIHTQDHPGLMAKISGALAVEGVNILSADITTTRDGMALDVFVVQNALGKALENREQLDKLEKTLTLVLTGKIQPQALLVSRAVNRVTKGTFDVPIIIEFDNSLDSFTLLEITSLDRMGLLFTITQEMKRHGIQIRTAKIATYGERAVDVFYVRDLFGFKLGSQKKIILERDLRKVLESLK